MKALPPYFPSPPSGVLLPLYHDQRAKTMKQKTDSGKPLFLPTEASLLVVQFIVTALALIILIAGILYAI